MPRIVQSVFLMQSYKIQFLVKLMIKALFAVMTSLSQTYRREK